VALNIGTNNATAINLNQNTFILKNADAWLTINATTGSGQIAGIKLQRGTNSDNYTDYSLYDSGGNFYMDMSDLSNGTKTPLTVLGGNGYLGVGTTTPSSLFSVGASNQFQVSSGGAVTAVGVNAGAGLLQGSLGLTITGAAVSLNASSNYATNINTGNSTGAVNIGNAASTFTITGSNSSSIVASTGTYTTTLNFVTPTANVIYQFPTAAAGTYNICTSANNCTGMGAYIQNQNSAQQSSSNFWISGTGRADTSFTTPLLDTATAVALNIGTNNATAINLNQNTTVATGKSLTEYYPVCSIYSLNLTANCRPKPEY
jgi:hypothetical protein